VEVVALVAREPTVPGHVVVDREWLGRLPHAAGEAVALLDSLVDVVRERAGADRDAQLVVSVPQVDIAVAGADELAGL
jgi:hypothetical protein